MNEMNETPNLYKLIYSSVLSLDERDAVLSSLGGLSLLEKEDLFWYLVMHQIDPIEQGMGYKQGDIQKKLDKVMLEEKL